MSEQESNNLGFELTKQQESFKGKLEEALKSNDNGGILVLGTGGTGRRYVMGKVFRDLSLEAKSTDSSSVEPGLPAIVVSVPPHYDLRDALVIILKRIAEVGEYYCRKSIFEDKNSTKYTFEEILLTFLKKTETKGSEKKGLKFLPSKETKSQDNSFKDYIKKTIQMHLILYCT